MRPHKTSKSLSKHHVSAPCTPSHSPHSHGYGSLIRRTIMFQIRLAADGLRDLLLSPISILAALVGIFHPTNPSWALDRLMKLGQQSDRWINLFEQESQREDGARSQTIDDWCATAENEIRTQMKTQDWSAGPRPWHGQSKPQTSQSQPD